MKYIKEKGNGRKEEMADSKDHGGLFAIVYPKSQGNGLEERNMNFLDGNCHPKY